MLSDLEVHYLRQMQKSKHPEQHEKKEVFLKHYVTDSDHLKSCFRNIVMNAIIRFKHEAFRTDGGYIYCPILETKTLFSECDIDHTHPNSFSLILSEFFSEFGIDKQECIGMEIIDIWRKYADDFRSFHMEYCVLGAVHQNANRRIIPSYVRTLPRPALANKSDIDPDLFYESARKWMLEQDDQKSKS